jgi:heptosyltransferase-1
MNVLIVKMSSMGDIIHTFPALTDAKHVIPEINFDWVIEENFAEIPKWHPAVKNVIPIAIRRWRHNLFGAFQNGEIKWFLKNLRNKHYDYVIDAQGLMKSGAVAFFARGVKCGYDRNSIREPLASIVYDKKFAISKKMHAITRIRRLFSNVFGYEGLFDVPDYGINTEIFADPVLPKDEDYVVFIHGTTSKNKCWAESSWQELARLATNAGLKVKIP